MFFPFDHLNFNKFTVITLHNFTNLYYLLIFLSLNITGSTFITVNYNFSCESNLRVLH